MSLMSLFTTMKHRINLPTVHKLAVEFHSIRATKPRKYLYKSDIHLLLSNARW